MDCKFEPEKAWSPIAVTEDGISIHDNDLQGQKVLLVDYQYYTL